MLSNSYRIGKKFRNQTSADDFCQLGMANHHDILYTSRGCPQELLNQNVWELAIEGAIMFT